MIDGVRDCIKCGPKPISCFHKHSQGRDGLNPKCKDCLREYRASRRDIYRPAKKASRKKRQGIVREFIRNLKRQPCMDCRNSFISEAMHFDHRPDEIKCYDPSDLVERASSMLSVERELAKCDLVCVGCHRKRNLQRVSKVGLYSCTKHEFFLPGCRACYMAEFGHIKQNKSHAFVDSKKLGRPCCDCGRIFEPLLMDFDHVSEDKIMDISTACSYGWSIQRLSAEIDKCDLVCCWCHVLRTVSRRLVP
jgi:hypothetical protein